MLHKRSQVLPFLNKIRGNTEERKREGEEGRGLRVFGWLSPKSSCVNLCGGRPPPAPVDTPFLPQSDQGRAAMPGQPSQDWNQRPVAALPPTGCRRRCRIQQSSRWLKSSFKKQTQLTYTHTRTLPNRAPLARGAHRSSCWFTCCHKDRASDLSVQGRDWRQRRKNESKEQDANQRL